MKPLSRSFRRKFFYLLVAVFVVGTPILIGYSKGYRLDDALSLIETGGIYIHSDMSDTRVYLNGKFVEEHGRLFKNTYLERLSPNKTYEVWVERDGYQSWTKRLRVFPNLVTEGRVLMLPDSFEWAAVEASTTIVETATTSSRKATTTRVLSNPEYEKLSQFFAEDKGQFDVEVASTTYVMVKGKRVATTTTLIEKDFPQWLTKAASTSGLSEKDMVRERDGVVAWLEDGNVHAIWARENDAPPFYFCVVATCTPELIIDWAEPIARFEFYPNRNDVVIVASERGLYAVEFDERSTRNIQPILTEPNLDFRLENNGSLVVFDGTMYRETSW